LTVTIDALQVSLVLPTVQDQLGIGTPKTPRFVPPPAHPAGCSVVCCTVIISCCCAGNTYLVFAGIGAIALVTIYLIVPETKGKTLEEIESMFASGGKGE